MQQSVWNPLRTRTPSVHTAGPNAGPALVLDRSIDLTFAVRRKTGDVAPSESDSVPMSDKTSCDSSGLQREQAVRRPPGSAPARPGHRPHHETMLNNRRGFQSSRPATFALLQGENMKLRLWLGLLAVAAVPVFAQAPPAGQTG